MNKLTLNDIAGYIPYQLKGITQYKNIVPFLLGVNQSPDGSSHCLPYGNIKPILRSMSTLLESTKIKNYKDGKKFIPLLEVMKVTILNRTFHKDSKGVYYTVIKDKIYCRHVQNLTVELYDDKGVISYLNLSLGALDLLNRWFFDYRGLIERGLAVDINTIDNSFSIDNSRD